MLSNSEGSRDARAKESPTTDVVHLPRRPWPDRELPLASWRQCDSRLGEEDRIWNRGSTCPSFHWNTAIPCPGGFCPSASAAKSPKRKSPRINEQSAIML